MSIKQTGFGIMITIQEHDRCIFICIIYHYFVCSITLRGVFAKKMLMNKVHTLIGKFFPVLSRTITRLASLMAAVSVGNTSCFFVDTSGSSSVEETDSIIHTGVSFIVHDFFQFDIELPSFGWVNKIFPPNGNLVSSAFQPKISKAILERQKKNCMSVKNRLC